MPIALPVSVLTTALKMESARTESVSASTLLLDQVVTTVYALISAVVPVFAPQLVNVNAFRMLLYLTSPPLFPSAHTKLLTVVIHMPPSLKVLRSLTTVVTTVLIALSRSASVIVVMVNAIQPPVYANARLVSLV